MDVVIVIFSPYISALATGREMVGRRRSKWPAGPPLKPQPTNISVVDHQVVLQA
jgi:hypothetical protein